MFVILKIEKNLENNSIFPDCLITQCHSPYNYKNNNKSDM